MTDRREPEVTLTLPLSDWLHVASLVLASKITAERSQRIGVETARDVVNTTKRFINELTEESKKIPGGEVLMRYLVDNMQMLEETRAQEN